MVVGEQLAHLGRQGVTLDLAGEDVGHERGVDRPARGHGFTDRLVETDEPGAGRLEHGGRTGRLLQPGGLAHDLVGSLPAPHSTLRRQATLCPQDRVQQAGGAGEP
jgi:hypothetical protein